ncbi:hypothetical protein ABPG72_007385 [Tetrahymena utriculariae]
MFLSGIVIIYRQQLNKLEFLQHPLYYQINKQLFISITLNIFIIHFIIKKNIFKKKIFRFENLAFFNFFLFAFINFFLFALAFFAKQQFFWIRKKSFNLTFKAYIHIFWTIFFFLIRKAINTRQNEYCNKYQDLKKKLFYQFRKQTKSKIIGLCQKISNLQILVLFTLKYFYRFNIIQKFNTRMLFDYILDQFISFCLLNVFIKISIS